MSAPLLQMTGIGKRFGATRALHDVSLSVQAGSVHALVGENGAGKSTLMKILSGAHPPDTGSMQLAGEQYAPRSPLMARRAGIAMIYQELSLAPHLSVVDNVMLGVEHSRLGFVNRRSQESLLTAALEKLGHAGLPLGTPVRRLSVGMQQVVEIARALVSQARVIVFDEPTSSLSSHDTEQLFNVIRTLRSGGLGVVYISHFLEELQTICDDYTVLRDGCVTGSGKMESVSQTELVTLMAGRSVEQLFPHVPHTAGEVLLDVSGLSGSPLPKSAGLQLRRGEIVGIAGLIGSGRSEFLRCLMGLDAIRSGRVTLSGSTLSGGTPQRVRRGIGMVSEDRKTEGLAQNLSIEDNLTLSKLQPYSTLGWMSVGSRTAAASSWMKQLRVKAQNPRQPVSSLSGGNQQKVAFARLLHQAADVLLLDEPTRGIDVGSKSEIYRMMGEAAAAGKAVLFVSSSIPELLAVCDRVGVMCRGELSPFRPANQWTEESVLATAVAANIDEYRNGPENRASKHGQSISEQQGSNQT